MTVRALAASGLLAAGDPDPVEILEGEGDAPLLVVCDHGGRAVPKALDDLGLAHADLSRHIAWDIGAAEASRRIARAFGATAVIARYSRLVVDCNRYVWDPASMPETSDGTAVPGNRGLAFQARERRMREIFLPYHEAIRRRLDELIGRVARPPLFLSVHSMTPRLSRGGEARPVFGISFAGEARASRLFADAMRRAGAEEVAENVPYALDLGEDYTTPEHALRRGLPYLQVEFRQDLIGDEAGIARWSALVRRALATLLGRNDVHVLERPWRWDSA